MKKEDLIMAMIQTLTNEFESNYTKEEIKSMKEDPINNFYSDSKNKYRALLDKYIEENAVIYLDKIYKEKDVSEQVKKQIFMWAYYDGCYNDIHYNLTLFKDEKSLVPKTLNDKKVFKDMLSNKDISLFLNILKVNESPEEILSNIKELLEYNFLQNNDLFGLLIGYSSSKSMNLNIYDTLFNDLCNKDNYGYYIYEFLSKDNIVITTNNILDIIENVLKFGNDIRIFDTTYIKSRFYYELIDRPLVKKKFDKDDIGCIEILKDLEYEIKPEFKEKKK